MEIMYVTALALMVAVFCSLETEGRPKTKGVRDENLRELLSLLRRKYKRVNGNLHEVLGEFELPDGFEYGSEQWKELEHNSTGNGHDIIENGDLDDWIGLFGSFEIMKNGEVIKPLIDQNSLTVQNAQNHDHHHGYDTSSGQVRKRNFRNGLTLWENGIIPYEIDTNTITKATDHAIIRGAIAEMNNLTCLQIIPRDQAPNLTHTSFIRFTDDNDGCASWVGRVQPTNQDIGLDDAENCVEKTTVLHEVMHAIGMDHEQQRQDRDDYIQMFWNNILNGQNNHNMYKTQTADRNAYDVESIMQYGLYSFAINNTAKTMKLLDSRLEFLVDSAKALTFYDVKDITAGYNCTQNCTSTNTPVCTNEGFLGHTCQCFCPPGLRGTTCQNVTTDSDCGGVITLSSGGSHVIESPNYPNNHTLDKVCVWLIKTPQGTNVSLTINEMDLRYDEEETRCYHWLEMRYNLLGQSGPKKCGVVNSTTSDISSSRSNLMMLRFDSRFSKDISAYKGFRLTVSIQGDSSTPAAQPCDSNPCKNGGTCSNSGSSFTCQCTAGWSGNTCEQQVQPCDSSPCQNGGTCSNNANGNTFTCSCVTGWSGPTCTVRPCDSSPCQNGGTCTNSGNTFTCACTTGWSGATCTVQPCDSSPCQNGGTCTNSGNTFTCACTTGWSGATCTVQPCDSSPCQNGGTCTNSGNTFTCACTTGWSGATNVTVSCKRSKKALIKVSQRTWMDFDGIELHPIFLETLTDFDGNRPIRVEIQNNTRISVSSTSICDFENSTPCFLNNGYTRTQVNAGTMPPAPSSGGSYCIVQDTTNYEVILSINHTAAGLTIGQQYCLGYNYTIGGTNYNNEIGVASDVTLNNALQYTDEQTAWTRASYSFTASANNPVLYILTYEDLTNGEYGAVDDVTLSSGSC